jgi:hypothetical protein
VGFGVDDHLIRELMKFIKMTSREFIIKDVTWKGGAPNYFCGWYLAQGGLISFYLLNLSIGKAILERGHYNWLKVCNQVLNLYTKHPHTSAKTASSTTPSPLLSC